jgi:DNA-binding NarL/FixJ family response regulator
MSDVATSNCRVVLVEDHPLFRDQLAQLINREPGMSVCGEADNIHAALELIESRRPDVAIVDLTLKGPSGLELIKNLKAREIDIPVLVLSMHDQALYAERVLKSGARGYITKNEASKEVMTALHAVLRGEIYLPPRIAARILENVTTGRKAEIGIEQLTDRELEVFELIGHGRSTREISNSLHLGMSTVDTYRARIKAKLHLESSSQLSHQAIRWVSDGQKLSDGNGDRLGGSVERYSEIEFS